MVKRSIGGDKEVSEMHLEAIPWRSHGYRVTVRLVLIVQEFWFPLGWESNCIMRIEPNSSGMDTNLQGSPSR